jgi:chromosome segregation ATPase
MSTDAEWKTAWDITVAAMNKQAELIEEKDKKITELHAWADTMLRKIEVLEAQIAANEQEHQDFRLQNDSEWRAKLDHLKAQIAAKDAALTHIVNECSRFPIKDGLAFRVESIALNGLNSPASRSD